MDAKCDRRVGCIRSWLGAKKDAETKTPPDSLKASHFTKLAVNILKRKYQTEKTRRENILILNRVCLNQAGRLCEIGRDYD